MTTPTLRFAAVLGAVTLLLVGAFLLHARGGFLSWFGAGVAALLLVKFIFRPSYSDFKVLSVATLVWSMAWLATWQYVKRTWESGEVVELNITTSLGPRIARVWVMDFDGKATVYYDAPPDIAGELLAGTPVSMSRGNSTINGCANAVEVSSLSVETQEEFLATMNNKYGTQSIATEIFYAVLGGNRKRLPVLVHVADCRSQ